MKNGINLFLILFLGVMGYFVVNDLYLKNSIMFASNIFLLISLIITYLTMHFKRRRVLSPAQKVINVIYISLFALYGFIMGLNLTLAPSMEQILIGGEGIIFLISSVILMYGVYTFTKTKIIEVNI